MATGVASWSTTAANNATADSNVNWAEGQAPSSVNNSARAEMASVALYRDDVEGSLTTGGTTTAYTVTTGQSFASLTALDGNMLRLRFNATNGAAPTLAVDGLTAKPIHTAAGTAVATGAILANTVQGLTYSNADNAFILHDHRALTTLALSGLDITGATAETAPAVADELPLYDASATANRKMTLANVLKVINALTAETSPATDDEVALYDTSAGTADKITLANLLTVLNALTEDTSPDESADFLLSYDTSASAVKKVKPNNIAPAASQGGALVQLQTQVASASSTIDFVNGVGGAVLDNTYDDYFVEISDVLPSVDGAGLYLRVGTGGTPTWEADAADYGHSSDSSDSEIELVGVSASSGLSNASGESGNFSVKFTNPESSKQHLFRLEGNYIQADNDTTANTRWGRYLTSEAITGIRFLPSSGNIASGRFSLYGIKKA